MDFVRPPRPHRMRLLGWGAFSLSVLFIAISLSRLKPAAPQVDRSSLLIDIVKRGAMVFQIRGAGVLVPIDVRIITAKLPCTVKRVLLYPGIAVKKESVIAELSSPELQQATEDAMWQMRQAEADYSMNYLNQKVTLDSARAKAKEADALLLATERLRREGLQSDLELLRVKVKAEEANGQLDAEEARMKLYGNKASLTAPARARLEQAKALYALKQEQLNSLTIRAGMSGILEGMPLQVGQQLAAGTIVATVANPYPLKAELKVNETEAKDILIGQSVDIDTHNGIVKGKVIRIDPVVINGTVTIDANMEGELPKGLRPSLSVEGIVEVDRATRVLFVGRPVQAQSFGTLSVFKVSPDESEAIRVKVKLGRASVSNVEILEGLNEGDRIILSDTSQYDGVDRIRLK